MTDEPRRSGALLLVSLAAGVLLITTVVFGVLAVRYKSERDEDTGERAEVAAVAGELMHAMLSFDYRDPEGSLAAVLDLASGEFADEFEEAAPNIAEAMAALEAVPGSVIRDVFVGGISENGGAEAIVFYDQVLDGLGGRNELRDCYSRLTLVNGPQGWTVIEVESLAGCGAVDVTPPPGATTTTTAPPG